MPDDIIKTFEEKMPKFKEMVEYAVKNKTTMVLLSLDSFTDDPDLVYLALWYLYTKNMNATFVSPKPPDDPKIILKN